MKDKLYWYKATCLRVIDGDTILVSIDCGLNIFAHKTVRLYGIDTPEVYGVKKGSEEYLRGKLASNRMSDLVLNSELWIQTIQDKTGKYGRYLAKVYKKIDGEFVCLNDLLVQEGLAIVKNY